MKKLLSNKILFSIIIAIFSIASFSGGLAYSIMNKKDNTNEEIIYKTPEVVEQDVFDYLLYNETLDKFITDSTVTENTIPVVSKEDPEVAKKKLEKEKGIAKETTAAQSIAKYETNETSLGIDVSYAQGKIDWAKVKQAGIKFAMIRVGFKGAVSGELIVDSRFYDNMKGAIANDINVGVYFFAGAVNESEAIEEAKFVTNLIKDYDISYPVAYDTEYFSDNCPYTGCRLFGVSNAQLTNNANAFANYIKNAGYTPMIYSYYNAFVNKFETARFGDTRIWLAHYTDSTNYKGKYYMWQYSSAGHVDGINNRVDMNVSYFSVTRDASKQSSVTGVLNNNDLEKIDFTNCYYDTYLINNVSLRSTPYLGLPNKAGSLSTNTKITVTGINNSWIRILYNGDTFYINDTNSYNSFDTGFTDTNIEGTTSEELQLYIIPVLNDNNKTIKLKKGTNIVNLGTNDNFTKIKYNDKTYYVNRIDTFINVNDRPNGSNNEAS